MTRITKIVHQQDAYLKIGPRKSGETSINLSMEITELIGRASGEVSLLLHKEDLLRALCAICALLPLYKSTSKKADEVVFSIDFFDKLHQDIEAFFEDNKEREYKVNLFVRPDGRSYLNDLKYEGLNVRNFLVENHSKMIFSNDNGRIDLRLETSLIEILEDADVDTEEAENYGSEFLFPLQQIFYGAPGTGKSHKVKEITGEKENEDKPNVFRTTFHPDTDYASFVGCYKPIMKPVPDKYQAVAGRDEDIAYDFVPQAFTDAYVYAYNHEDEPTYLVIEEINRGNCAQIFGDLFQLLDRNENGTSDYKIKADKDLAKYLKDGNDVDGNAILANKAGIKDGKLCLPSNLYILATMNTSDQSLFPIDSAFKRRWDWEYVAIDYNEPKSSAFTITIGSSTFKWVDFIKEVNKKIFDLTQSEDKQMGNFFIKSSVDQKQFCSKVMFYLWNEVLKDEVENTKYFFYEDKGNDRPAKFTFTDLYGSRASDVLTNFMKYLKVNYSVADSTSNVGLVESSQAEVNAE